MERYFVLVPLQLKFATPRYKHLTNSFSSLIANAADDIAIAMSTSSTSFEISPNVFLHSSTKGPVEVSFAIVPTFFCLVFS